MTDAESMPQQKLTLSAKERLRLVRALNGLVPVQFEELLLTLNLPPGILPSGSVAQGNRTYDLLRWVESSTGPGLIHLQKVLSLVTKDSTLVSESLTTSSIASIFTVPYYQNLYFTGREDTISTLHSILQSGQPAALSGLGGIGKTQTAVEYAYRHRDKYTNVLWLRVSVQEDLASEVVKLAQELELSPNQDSDQTVIIQTVKTWLSNNDGWLLVLDDVDHLEIVQDWLSLNKRGHVILTTRASETRPRAQCIKMLQLPPEEGALLLLRRSGKISGQANLGEARDADKGLAMELCQAMDGLPLALDQAGAFILETQCSLEKYELLYRTAAPKLLARRGELATDHPSVEKTFSLAFEQLAQQNSVAADLLRFCAFLAPDAIPEEVFTQGVETLPESLKALVESPLQFIELLREAGCLSLIYYNGEEKTLDIHRLVQSVLRDSMDTATQRQWVIQVIKALNAVFPRADFAEWSLCELLLPHALAVIRWLDTYHDIRFNFEEAINLLSKTGLYLSERARFHEAESFLEEALKLREDMFNYQHLEVADNLHHLALLYRRQGRYTESEPLFLRALSIKRDFSNDEDARLASILHDLAQLYYYQGNYKRAEPLFLKSLNIRESIYGENHPEVAVSLHNLGNLYKFQGRYKEAEEQYLRALSIRESIFLDPEHKAVADSLNNLALLYYYQGRYHEAEPQYLRVIEADKRNLGPSHPDVATSLNNLALLYLRMKRYGEAESYLHQSLLIRKAIYGEEHPAIAQSLNNLGELHELKGNYEEAKSLYIRALTLERKLLIHNHPDRADSLNDLAGIYRKQGNLYESRKLYLEALTLALEGLGRNHPYIATSLHGLGIIKRKQHNYKHAKVFLSQALAISQAVSGMEHPTTSFYAKELVRLKHLQLMWRIWLLSRHMISWLVFYFYSKPKNKLFGLMLGKLR